MLSIKALKQYFQKSINFEPLSSSSNRVPIGVAEQIPINHLLVVFFKDRRVFGAKRLGPMAGSCI